MPSTRALWLLYLQKVAAPVLKSLAAGKLRAKMPVEAHKANSDRPKYSHLEAFGRTLCGIAPWLDLPADENDEGEGRLRAQFVEWTRAALRNGVNPESPDFLNFSQGQQPIVDAAFLAQAVLRAPHLLNAELPEDVRAHLLAAFLCTRDRKPGFNNWLLFAATIEAAIDALGGVYDPMRVDYALRQHEQWYKGDGVYGDGPAFHFDYYNAYVIQPMLLDILERVGERDKVWGAMREKAIVRARRYAAVQERFIAPDGSFPPVGRSLAYRAGAFQALSQMALRRDLPAEVSPAQARCALTAVLRRTLDAPQTFDENGWLRIGLCGHQPAIGEGYISTGSLYLCSAAFLPLGLRAADPFWTEPDTAWTSVRVWNGENVPADHALHEG